jgi:hypothetical protein
MNDDERQQLDAMQSKLDDMHDAFFREPPGGGKTLMQKLRIIVDAYDRGSWLLRSVFWLIPAASALIIGWDRIKAFFWKALP